ncbi:MAG: trypsin-like peptidase domain-containing protein [Bacteroidia bacterium]|nr:trypsin-like peptidase domain-containing protein [Bacteroidia bacterium]
MNSSLKRILGIFLIALTGSVSGVGLYKYFFEKEKFVYMNQPLPAVFSKYNDAGGNLSFPSFTHAVEVARPGVVHIRSIFEASSKKNKWGTFGDDFFGNRDGAASGSGVIISPKGYIATNNHVIEDATKIEVTLPDNRKMMAELIGRDPSTDLALLKIEGENYPYVEMGNSDILQIGEWVVAIGNPLELTSTVTAGIVSAKGRDIRLLEGQYRIESFIQTDAAVNPGNSGGALVDVNGKLVGINTAIASRTGLYAGYSFAVPSIIVKKIMDDLLQFGEVRRGILGISIENVTADKAEENDLSTLQGAYIAGVSKGGGADKAGLKKGDVIVAINEAKVSNSAELQEQVGRFRPGDKLKVKFLRGSAAKEVEVILKKIEGNTDVVSLEDAARDQENEEEEKGDVYSPEDNSAFVSLSVAEKDALGIANGVKVEKPGVALSRGGIKTGFIITKINGKSATSEEVVRKEIINSKGKGMISLEGLYKKDMYASYQFNW